MSTTPRTDAAEIKMQCGFKETPTGTVQADFARQLERELAAERERADRAKAEGIKEGMRVAADIAGAEEDQFIALAGEAADNTMRKHYSALASGAGTAAAAILKEAGE